MADSKAPLQSPGSSWESIKKIIRAYNAVADDENPTVENVAVLAGLQRPVVSGNNNFLRSTGILQENANKLTDVGYRLATGMGINNPSLVSSALRDIIRGQAGLNHLLNMLRARSVMSMEAFRGEIVMITGLDANSRNLQFLKTIVDMLSDSGMVKVENDEIAYRGIFTGEIDGRAHVQQTPKPNEAPKSPSSNSKIVPISLGVGRLVNVELPEDWSSGRDLPKLLKMLELSLGEEHQQ
jgi:hypothetical protein